MTYTEKLKHPRWQRRRLERLEAAGWACSRCGNCEKTLHVHHLRYLKGREPWEYSDHDLVALCEDCHQSWHEQRERIELALSFLPDQEIVLGFIEGAIAVAHSDFWFDMRGEAWAEGFAAGCNASDSALRLTTRGVVEAGVAGPPSPTAGLRVVNLGSARVASAGIDP